MPSRLTLGTAQLGLPYGLANQAGLPSWETAEAILETAFALGIRTLDTAPGYGESERRIGRYLREHGRPDGLELVTKLGSLGKDCPAGEIAARVESSVEESLRDLSVERLDVLLLHDAQDLRRHGEGLVRALCRQLELGRVGAIGLSIYEPSDCEPLFGDEALTAIEHPLNLLDRRIVRDGMLGRLSARGTTCLARSALLQGLLLMDPARLPARMAHARSTLLSLRELLAEWSLEPADVALAFCAATPGVSSVLVGVEDPGQLAAHVEAIARPLPDGFREALESRLPEPPLAILDPRKWPT